MPYANPTSEVAKRSKLARDERYRDNNRESIRLRRIRRSIGPRTWEVRGRCSVCQCETSYRTCGHCNQTRKRDQQKDGWKFLLASIRTWLRNERP